MDVLGLGHGFDAQVLGLGDAVWSVLERIAVISVRTQNTFHHLNDPTTVTRTSPFSSRRHQLPLQHLLLTCRLQQQ